MLTDEQLTALRDDILADPVLAAYPMSPDGAFAIKEAYNLLAVPDFIVWRTAVPVSEIINNGFIWTAVDVLEPGKARIWDWMRESGVINPSKPNVRQGLQDAFGGSQTNITKHLKRPATRAEKLLAIPGATNTMTFEGFLGYTDIEQARAL